MQPCTTRVSSALCCHERCPHVNPHAVQCRVPTACIPLIVKCDRAPCSLWQHPEMQCSMSADLSSPHLQASRQ